MVHPRGGSDLAGSQDPRRAAAPQATGRQ